MVHCRTFFRKFRHALQYSDIQSAVSNDDAKEFPFESALFFLVSLRFFPAFLQLLLSPLSVAFPYQLVVFGFEVGRTDIFRVVRVLAEMLEQVYHIAPHRAVLYGVAVADAYLYGCPISFHIERAIQAMTQHGVLSLSLLHISEPTRPRLISYAVFCLKKKTQNFHIILFQKLFLASLHLFSSSIPLCLYIFEHLQL